MPVAIPRGGVLQATAAQALPFPTTQRAAAVEAIAAYLRRLRALPQTRWAVALSVDGSVEVPDRLSYIYATLGSPTGPRIEAKLLNLLSPEAGDTLLVRQENPGGAGAWVVLDWYGTGTPPILVCDDCVCTGELDYKSFSSWGAGLTDPEVGVAVPQGDYVYNILNKPGSFPPRVLAIDVSVDTAPTLADSYDYSSNVYNVAGLDVSGDLLYATFKNNSSATDSRILLFDISSPSALSLPGANDHAFGYALQSVQLVTIGGTKYLAAMFDESVGQTNTGLRLFNVSNPASLSVTSSINPASIDFRGEGRDANKSWHIANNIFYTLLTSPSFTTYIFIYDLSTPASPSLEVQYSTGYESLSTVRANATHLWVGAKKVLDTDRYLVCFDISNPASPSLVSETVVGVGAGETIQSIALCGDIAFLAKNTTTTVKFESWDISNPAAPTLLDTLTAPDTMRVPVHPVRVDGTHLYLAGSANLLTTQPRLIIATC